jgi:hypothetical protein
MENTNNDIEVVEDNIFDESGMTTAELLGNAALAIVALIAIWGALQLLGTDIIDYIRGQLGL